MGYMSSAGTPNAIDGTLTTNRIPFASDSDTLTDDADFTYDSVTDTLLVANVQLTGGTGTQGKMSWNTDEETVDLVLDGATLQLGQELHIHARNDSGSTISNGTPVYITGTLGASGRVLVAPMIANGTITPRFFLGMATEDIVNGADGKITSFGKVRGLNTTGSLYGEVWADGDLIYVSPSTAGYLTNVQPTAPNLNLEFAIVINAHASTGTLFVRTERIGDYLNDLHGVLITSVADNDLLQYNNAQSRWENVSVNNVVTQSSVTQHQAALSITESQISDLGTYLTTETDPVVGAVNGIVKANGGGTISAAVAGTDYLTPTGDGSGLSGVVTAEVNDLSAAVTWANVPDANITESSVTQHREAIQDRVIVETGNDSPAASAAESGNYFYRASGETATFTIPQVQYVGEYYVLMNNSGSAITIASTASDTLVGSTSISDGAAATVVCAVFSAGASTLFVIG